MCKNSLPSVRHKAKRNNHGGLVLIFATQFSEHAPKRLWVWDSWQTADSLAFTKVWVPPPAPCEWSVKSGVWWCTLVIPALRRQRPEDQQFKANLH